MGLLLPPGVTRADAEKIYRCTWPGCDKEFPESQKPQWARHVCAHQRRDGEVLEEAAHLRESNAFTGIVDPERFFFHRRRAAK